MLGSAFRCPQPALSAIVDASVPAPDRVPAAPSSSNPRSFAVVTLRPSRFCNQIQLLFRLCDLDDVLASSSNGRAHAAVGFTKDMWRHIVLSLCTDPLMAAPVWRAEFAVRDRHSPSRLGPSHVRLLTPLIRAATSAYAFLGPSCACVCPVCCRGWTSRPHDGVPVCRVLVFVAFFSHRALALST